MGELRLVRSRGLPKNDKTGVRSNPVSSLGLSLSVGSFQLGQQIVALNGIATFGASIGSRMVMMPAALVNRFGTRKFPINGGFGLREMSFSDGMAVERKNLSTQRVSLRLRSEVVSKVLPVVATLVVGA